MFFDFRKKGREREKHWCRRETRLSSCCMCPDQGSNPQRSEVWDDTPTSWTTRPGLSYTFYYFKCFLHILFNFYFFVVILLQLSQFSPFCSPPPSSPLLPHSFPPHSMSMGHSFIHVLWLVPSPSFYHYHLMRILASRILCCGCNRQIHTDYRKRDSMATL